MPFWSTDSPSIYCYSRPYFGSERQKPQLCRDLVLILEHANTLSMRFLNQKADFVPSNKFVSDPNSGHQYKQLFIDFIKSAVVCLGARMGQDREIRLISGVVAFVVGLANIYFVGQHYMERAEAIENEERVRYERTVFLPTFRQYTKKDNLDMQVIRKVLALEEEVFAKIRRHAEYSLAVRVGLFAASLMGMIAAVWGTTMMIAASFVLGALTSVGWLVIEGLSTGANEQRRTVEKMHLALKDLRLRTTF